MVVHQNLFDYVSPNSPSTSKFTSHQMRVRSKDVSKTKDSIEEDLGSDFTTIIVHLLISIFPNSEFGCGNEE